MAHRLNRYVPIIDPATLPAPKPAPKPKPAPVAAVATKAKRPARKR